jgi:hypothetical protein
VNTAIILFLNKRDLFEKKVLKVPLRAALLGCSSHALACQVPINSVEPFADYSGKERNFTDGVAYFQVCRRGTERALAPLGSRAALGSENSRVK